MVNSTTAAPLANIDRLHRFMDEHDLSAVIARSGVNFTYLSGAAYAGTLARLLSDKFRTDELYVIPSH